MWDEGWSPAAAAPRDALGRHLGGRGSRFVPEYGTTQDRLPVIQDEDLNQGGVGGDQPDFFHAAEGIEIQLAAAVQQLR